MKTHQDFIKEMHEKHPNINIVGTYTGSANKIEWVCSSCGESQYSLPSNLLKPEATGLCRKCFLLQLSENRKKGNEQFLQKLKDIHPDIIVTGIFKGNNHKIEWVCSNCGQKQYSFPVLFSFFYGSKAPLFPSKSRNSRRRNCDAFSVTIFAPGVFFCYHYV